MLVRVEVRTWIFRNWTYVMFTSMFQLLWWTVEAASSLTAAAAATGASATPTEAQPPLRQSQSPASARPRPPTKAWIWSWSRCCSTSRRRGNAGWADVLVFHMTNQTAPQPSADGAFPPAELGEGGLQVSVAELWEGAHISGGNQTSHPDNTPVVRLTWQTESV